MKKFRRLFRLRFGRGADLERELDDEIETHLSLRTEELIELGMDPKEARQEAERRFGGIEPGKARIYRTARRREQRIGFAEVADDLRRHVGLAFRRAARAPGRTAMSVSIFAFGLALATTMFTVVDHVLLRPLPFPEPDRLVSLQSVGESGSPFPQVSMENWIDWRDGERTLAAMALHRTDRSSLTVGTEAFRATATRIEGDFFLALGLRFVAGRPFGASEGDERAGVAVVASGFASRYFGSPVAALGQRMDVAGVGREIVGVVAAGQDFPENSEVWVPGTYRPGSGTMRNNINFLALARLDEGSDIEDAGEDLSRIARGIMEREPEAVYSYAVGVLPLHDVVTGGAGEYLWVLMAAVGGVLLVACANLAGLSLAEARGRARETAVRLALGSSRRRIVNQALVEHLALAVVGGLLGLALTAAASGFLFDQVRAAMPRSGDLSVDGRIAAFAIVVSLFSGLLAGVAPALQLSGTSPGAGLGSTRGTIRGGRALPGAALVATEIALAAVLLIGGGLLLRSFQTVLDRDLGFDPNGVVTAEVTLTSDQYDDDEQAVAYWQRLLDSLEGVPGVESAAAANWIPTGRGGAGFIELEGNPDPDFGAGYRVVSDGYHRTMSIPLLEGRTFDPTDDAQGERIVVVNETLAAQAWPGQSALGQRIRALSMESWLYINDPPWLTVVGVVADVRHYGLESEPPREMYVLHRQVPSWTRQMTAVVRTRGEVSDALVQAIQTSARSIDPTLAFEIGTLDQRVSDLLRERRMTLAVIVGFSLAALLLTCLGIYGLVSFAASQRAKEMAIRSALGAKKHGVLGLMLGGATRVIVIGAVIGLAAAYALGGVVEALLVDVPATDPMTYASVAALLLLVGLAAAAAPAVRAARRDPMAVLSRE